jgi:hypothetical protein
MIKRIKSKRKQILVILPLLGALLLLGPYFAVIQLVDHTTPAQYQARYEQATSTCKDRVWVVTEDIGPVYSSIKAPYPKNWSEAKGGVIYDFACSEKEALDKAMELSNKDTSNDFAIVLARLLAIGISWLLGVSCLVVWIVLVIQSIYRRLT